ncbi:ATP-dependent helicase [Butyrivibrio sp. YAB3001]|uniref:ATP-dependent helicase n=1 Tax=Butyrivibrio sp. YAB3001 TaxID=1520812 RepID=UPI0008F62D8B|nr:ATP-dependent helicase [Butyrivibrio sp. YAB3001]SFB68051.1 DNA helicase-2 / ATP-dependent DNA helicase PcrA [Butyrivibrio sp. YAB3001]
MKNNPQTGNNDVCGNAAQMKAILHKDGPAMVLAGPGSGKTFVIVQRLRSLIEKYDVSPQSILVITFTKAAAIEMQQRFMKITDNSYPEVCFGTFHSVFYQIIRQANPNNKFEIINETTKYKLLKDIIYRLKANSVMTKEECDDALEVLKDIVSEISRVKNTGDNVSSKSEKKTVCAQFDKVYEEYNKCLLEFGFIDFDDMVKRCLCLLEEDKALLANWSSRFKYILIDEYQDINMIQYKVIRLLCSSNNLFVVGDDDQSIYGFRGSDPGIMQRFAEDFVNERPEIINLNVNYRCGRTILENANRLIEVNKIRFKKELIANDTNGVGILAPRKYTSKANQTKAIITFLQNRKDNLDDIAFIFRTNSEALSLAAVLKEAGIPTNLDNQAKSFYDSPAVKLCEAYLSFTCCGHKREDFIRIMNNPKRYISREALCSGTVNENDLKHFYYGNTQKTKEIEKLFRQLNMISHMRPSLSIRFIRNEIGIDKLYPGEIDALNELSELSLKMTDNKILLKQLSELREQEQNKTCLNKIVKSRSKVNLMTMHGSKGLEFDTVWLPNLNEGIIPSRSSVTQSEIEEERRMLYVGMTRAKRALIMSYITGSEENKMLPSRFLRPLRDLWEKAYSSSPSSPSSGSSTISSNSTSSR